MGIFDLFRGRKSTPGSANEIRPGHGGGLPTVRFDRKRVTPPVKQAIREIVTSCSAIPTQLRLWVCDVANESVMRGGDLFLLTKSLVDADLPGMGQKEAADLARFINNRATSMMRNAEQARLGITHAKWLHAGSPCFLVDEMGSPRPDTHAAVSGQVYLVVPGMLIDGVRTWPGHERGCKCVSSPILPGFD